MIKHLFDVNGNAKFTCEVLVHYYDLEDGGYNGSSKVRIIKGTGIPCFSTLLTPPSFREKECPVFINGVWGIVEDNRGAIITNDGGQTHYVMNGLGPLPEGFVITTTEISHG